MAAQPNLGGLARLVYVLVGLGLMWGGFSYVEIPWLRIGMPVGGAILLVEGLIGWCATVAVLRRAGKAG